MTGSGPILSISPDGSLLAYVGGEGTSRAVYVRRLNEVTSRKVPGTDGAIRPVFSPDGSSINAVVDQRLRRFPLDGGPAMTVVEQPGTFSVGADGAVAFVRDNALWYQGAPGVEPTLLYRPDLSTGETAVTWPFLVSEVDLVLFGIRGREFLDDELHAIRLSDTTPVSLGIQGLNARHVSEGYLLFGTVGGQVRIVPFDAGAMAVAGPSATVLEDVVVRDGGAVEFSLAEDGTAVWLAGKYGRVIRVQERSGGSRVAVERLENYSQPWLSPDGASLAVSVTSAEGREVQVLSLASGALARVREPREAVALGWTGDGSRVVVRASDRIGMVRPDGNGAPVWLTDSASAVADLRVSPNGNVAVLVKRDPSGATDLFVSHPDSLHDPQVFVDAFGDQSDPNISPSEDLVAYVSNETGRNEVYIRAFTEPSNRVPVSTTGGISPRWSADGSELYFENAGGQLRAVTVRRHPLSVGDDRYLFDDPNGSGSSLNRGYDVGADGRFYFTFVDRSAEQIIVAQQWFQRARQQYDAAVK
jgi:Tol biopolymer transport system component